MRRRGQGRKEVQVEKLGDGRRGGKEVRSGYAEQQEMTLSYSLRDFKILLFMKVKTRRASFPPNQRLSRVDGSQHKVKSNDI